MSSAAAFPKEYLQGIDLFNQGNFFEAHEVWESIWMRSQGDTRLFYQALIQAAGALLHLRNKNYRGAYSLEQASLDKFSQIPDAFLGLRVRDFCAGFSAIVQKGKSNSSNLSEIPRIVLAG